MSLRVSPVSLAALATFVLAAHCAEPSPSGGAVGAEARPPVEPAPTTRPPETGPTGPLGAVVPPNDQALARCGTRFGGATAVAMPIDVAASATTTITATGPTDLVDRVATFEAKRRSCETFWSWGSQGFTFDWGDDPDGTRKGADDQPILASGCTDMRRHTYTVPGAYRPRAVLFHPGPNDAPIVEWTGEAEITVASPSSATELEILPGLEGKTLYYQQGTTIPWRWKPAKPLAIEVAVVKEDGTVVDESVVCPSAYTGIGERQVRLVGDQVDEHIRKGPIAVKARVRLFDGATMVHERTSGSFQYTPQMSPTFETPTVASVSGSAHAVRLSFPAFEPSCLSYAIDWGDGLPVDANEASAPSTNCTLALATITRDHTYAQAGSYTVKLVSNRFSPFKPLAQVVPYQIVTAVVP